MISDENSKMVIDEINSGFSEFERMIFEHRVINKIKAYFPGVEVKTFDKPLELSISYGLAEENKLPPEYEYVHKLMHSDNVSYKESEEAAEEDLIKELSSLRFYKSPKLLFIRAVGTNHDRDHATSQDRYLSFARFSLGYKI